MSVGQEAIKFKKAYNKGIEKAGKVLSKLFPSENILTNVQLMMGKECLEPVGKSVKEDGKSL